MIIRIFAAREPAKPLNDAQMCGSFLLSQMSTTEFYSDFAMADLERTRVCSSGLTKTFVFQKIFFKTLYHHRILTELKQISCEATS